jgi:hypothetical protein
MSSSGALTTQHGNGRIGYTYALTNPQTGLFPASDNANAILTVNRHPGNYYSQLGFSSNGNLYYRNFVNTAINTSQGWQTIWTSTSLTNLNQLTNGPGYTSNTGTVTSVSGTGSYGGLTLTGTVTTSGNITLGGTPTGTWPISVSGNAATATSATSAATWTSARTLTIGNTGKSVNGSANVAWTLAEIGAYAATNPSGYATTGYVDTAVAELVDTAPDSLNTLRELAAALGEDPNFATTITTALGAKAPLASPALTGTPTAPTAATATNTTQIATTAYVKAQGYLTSVTNISGNAGSATVLQTARTLTIGATGKTFNGSANVAWTLAEIGAQAAGSYAAASHTHTSLGSVNFNNGDLTNINTIRIGDPGPGEGLIFDGGNGWALYESPNDLVTNSAGNLQIVRSGVRVMTLDTSNNAYFAGQVLITSALLSNQANLDVDSGATRVIATVSSSLYDAAFFDFVIKKGTSRRSGTVYAVHNGTSIEFTETSTSDIGDTTEVKFTVDLSGGTIRLLATTVTNDWIIKTLVRGI